MDTKKKEMMKRIVYQNDKWEIIFIKGGLYVLMPKFKVQPTDWTMCGGAYAIALPKFSKKRK